MERRRALGILGALATIPALRSLGAQDLLSLGERIHASLDNRAAPRTLTATQYATVVAAAEQIIPRTDTPGATDARVADFVDTMLSDWYDAADRDRFLAGIDALGAQGFASADATQQLMLLTARDDELTALRHSGDSDTDRHWFAMLKFLTVWGYYTSQAGIEQELREQFMPGLYKGDVPYAKHAAGGTPGAR